VSVVSIVTVMSIVTVVSRAQESAEELLGCGPWALGWTHAH
jgi:hypothetical protein